MDYVIGIDLGTSAVKALLVDRTGRIAASAGKEYPLHLPKAGYSEQNPEDWVRQTIAAVRELMDTSGISPGQVQGIAFSGQMHGLVLLDGAGRVLRPAILWNDTRTTEECRRIEAVLGGRLLEIARNPALEGFTLPKLLWVMRHEPDRFAAARVFLLPKDYLRYRLTGQIHTEYSDAAGTLLLDVAGRRWSEEICEALGIEPSLCPPLVESHAPVGELLPEMAAAAGLSPRTKVFAGGADNACGAIGAGILAEGDTMCSIGTSGVVLRCEGGSAADYGGKVHLFNHARPGSYYAMGVTLAAGYSLSWFKDTFAPNESFEQLTRMAEDAPPGSGGLLFTPYLAGERTPHADALIRGSFIGIDGSHEKKHFVRAVLEGITFSLQESVDIFRRSGRRVDSVVSIGGGAKSRLWLQMQADIFDAEVVALANEQGPGMGAAMLAAFGSGWFDSLDACAAAFVSKAERYRPDPDAAARYRELFAVYREVYTQTRGICAGLMAFR